MNREKNTLNKLKLDFYLNSIQDLTTYGNLTFVM